MLEVNKNEVVINAVRASGPGGQNVNKVSSAVHLKFNIFASSLPQQVKDKLYNLNDSRITDDGIIIIKAKSFRSLEKNTQEAFNRLNELIQKSLKTQKKRKKTKPTKASVERRLESKKKKSLIKKQRQKL